MSLVKLENVNKNYEMGEITIPALKNINIEINEKSFITFIGPSGSGKSTLLNILGCLDKPSSGRIIINDTDTTNFNKHESAVFRGNNIGFIFQNFNLLPILTVYENVEYPLIMVRNQPQSERRPKILDILEKVGMIEQKNKYPNQLSGGQRQRVAIARALVTNPKLVLADEPTANLDKNTAFKIIDTMHNMKNEIGTTFIFATHDTKIVGEVETIYTIEDGIITNKKNQDKYSK